MKRTALTILLLFAAVLAMAGNVTPEKAGQLASSFFSSNTRSAAKVSLVWDGTDGLTRAATAPAFYVFNREGGGFVVIAGDDAAVPVLGFSETGTFCTEGMPENILHWFDSYTAQINYLRNIGEKQRASGAALWERVAREGIRTYSPVKRVETPSWGQKAPFNNLCPVVDGGKSVAGCVCIAVCEVMFIHKWPLTTKGDLLPDYEYKTDKNNTQTITGHNLSTSYDWANIKASYKGSYTDDEATAVATLVHDVGVMLQSDYNPTGTGAMAESIVPQVLRYMDYDSSAFLLYREECTAREWSNLIKKDIDAGLPVLYGGDGEGGGHQFVVDGYATDDYFYVNWGWNGSDNGYFKLSSFILDADYDFRFNSSAIFNFKKNEGGKAPDHMIYYLDNNYKGGVSLAGGSFAKGKTVKVSIDNLCNYSEGTFVGQVALGVVDWKGAIKAIYSAEDLTLEPMYGVGGTIEATLTEDPALGDRLMICYKGQQDWRPVYMDPYYHSYMVDAVPAYDYPAIWFDKTLAYKAGDVMDLRIINSSKPSESLVWYLDGKKMDMSQGESVTSIELPAGKHTLRATAKFGSITQTLYQVINVQ